MLHTTIRIALALSGITGVVIVLTHHFYTQAVETLARLEKLAHAAIPAVLAVALLYRVLTIVKRDKE